MSKVVLLSVFGADRPGITATLTKTLSLYNISILDIGQAVIHNTLSLGILLRIPDSSEQSPVFKDILYKGYEMGLTVKFEPISSDNYEEWVNSQGKDRFILTILAELITAKQISAVSEIISSNGLNISSITRLTGRQSLNKNQINNRSSIEMLLRGKPYDLKKLRNEIMSVSKDCGIDIAFQFDDIYRRNRRLIAFDMDSTLIQCEVIDELAREAGVIKDVSAITERAMKGEIDFNTSLSMRLSYLKGLDQSVLPKIADRLPLTAGVERLMENLKNIGYKTAIISGGFTYFGKYLQQKLGFDYVFANELQIINGKLTGKVIGDVVNAQKKAELLNKLSEEEKIRLEQTIAVGDGANDLPMLNTAGLGIAFHAKPLVKENAKQSISKFGLDGILYLLGFSDREMI